LFVGRLIVGLDFVGLGVVGLGVVGLGVVGLGVVGLNIKRPRRRGFWRQDVTLAPRSRPTRALSFRCIPIYVDTFHAR
jgi:hypothetical protein